MTRPEDGSAVRGGERRSAPPAYTIVGSYVRPSPGTRAPSRRRCYWYTVSASPDRDPPSTDSLR